MKFIHTADLHIGNRMHDVDRNEEYSEFFRWLKETIVIEGADTLVIAGDIYDVYNPTTEARVMFNRFLASLLDSSCSNIIIVGGNHDSGALLDSNKELMEALNIHVVGSITGREISDAVFNLYDSDKNVIGICAAIPFVKETDLRAYYDGGEENEYIGDAATKKLYDMALEEAKRIRGNLNVPIIATGHLYAANLEGRYTNMDRHERQDDGVRVLDVVGNLGSIHSDSFSDEYAYVALGHIHYTSRVAGNAKIRYSGSPFVMGFDEADIPRNVLSVECLPGGTTTVNPCVVPQNCHYKRLDGNCSELRNQLLNLSSAYNDDKKIYVEVRYNAADSSEVTQMIDDIQLPDNISIVSTKIARTNNSADVQLGNMTMREMQNLDPLEIFRKRIMEKLAIDDESDENREKIDTYLSYFLEAYNQVQGRDNSNEDN